MGGGDLYIVHGVSSAHFRFSFASDSHEYARAVSDQISHEPIFGFECRDFGVWNWRPS